MANPKKPQPKPKAKAKTPRAEVDWDAIEPHYRANIRTLRELGEEYGVSASAITQHANKKGWTRDLGAQIRAKAEAKVEAEAVSEERRANEKAVIEGNAELQYRIRMKHRTGLSRLSIIKDKLLDHVESVVDNLSDLGEVVEVLRNPDENGKDAANDKMRKAMERSSVVEDLRKLAEIDERVRKGEREAFGIDDKDAGDSPVDALLKKINSEHGDGDH